jgi:GNAT superfamily N-acetyltransferase
MVGNTSPQTNLAPRVLVVEWDALDAEMLRAEMSAEVGPRYAHLELASRGPSPISVDRATVHQTFVAYAGVEPVGHAAVRWNAGDLELKRMFVRPAYRGSGTATVLLHAAEASVRAAGRPRMILQTGHLQPKRCASTNAVAITGFRCSRRITSCRSRTVSRGTWTEVVIAGGSTIPR